MRLSWHHVLSHSEQVTETQSLVVVNMQVGLRLQLWRGSATWAAAVATWHSTPFLKLDVPALDATIARYEWQLHDMEAGLPANEVPAQP